MARPSRKSPRERVAKWPVDVNDAPATEGLPTAEECDDVAVQVAIALAWNVRIAMLRDQLTYRAAQERTGVYHTTIGDIVRGAVWPDVETVARLEAGLNAGLWPTERTRVFGEQLNGGPGVGTAVGGPKIQYEDLRAAVEGT